MTEKQFRKLWIETFNYEPIWEKYGITVTIFADNKVEVVDSQTLMLYDKQDFIDALKNNDKKDDEGWINFFDRNNVEVIESNTF